MIKILVLTDRLNFLSLWFFTGIVLTFIVIYLSLTPHPPSLVSFDYGDKAGHLLAYGILTGWFGQLYTRRISQFWIFILFCLMGVTLEFAQDMGGVRMFEYADMLANCTGAALGWWLTRNWLAGTLRRCDKLLLKYSRPKMHN